MINMPEEQQKQDPVKQRLDDINAISIAIDTYDDIFSDFDPRDISQRDLSEDFLNEIMHRHRQNPKGKYDVVLVAPISIQDQIAEKKIISRLNRYFHQKHAQYNMTINEIRIRGSIYVALGMFLLIMLSILTYNKLLDRLSLELTAIIFTPLGWFGIWEGFSKIVDIPFNLASSTQAYLRLAKASYKFEYIGEQKK
jgi:hypothetical protein